MLRQQSAIGRALGMEGVRRLAALQMDGGQRRQIIGVDKVARLYSGVSKLGAEQLSEGIAGQSGQECRRQPRAPQTDGNVETRSSRVRLVRQVTADRPGRGEVDECVARNDDRWRCAELGSHAEVSRTASSKVRAASAVVGSVKNCSATSGAMVKQSTPWRASATMSEHCEYWPAAPSWYCRWRRALRAWPPLLRSLATGIVQPPQIGRCRWHRRPRRRLPAPGRRWRSAGRYASGGQHCTGGRAGARRDELDHHFRTKITQPLSALDQCVGVFSPCLQEDLPGARISGPAVDLPKITDAPGSQDRRIGRGPARNRSPAMIPLRDPRYPSRASLVLSHLRGWCLLGHDHENHIPPSTTID